MSNHLAVATVTAVLKRIVLDAIQADVQGVSHFAWTVRPAEVPKEKAGVNLYLHQVAPNPHWRNQDAPTRRADGTLLQRPQAALDLHYLLTFHGSDDELVPQRLLGATVKALHARPVLTRERIRQVVEESRTSPPPDDYLADSDLAEQVESVRVTPTSLTLEESSKLWSAIQSPQVLCLTYQATLVLLDADERPGSALPVRRWGTHAVSGRPVVDRAEPESGRDFTVRSVLLLHGRGLRGAAGTVVRIGERAVEPPDADVSDRRVRVPLLSGDLPAGALRAGLHPVTVEHDLLLGDPAAPHAGPASEPVALLLRPRILPKEPLVPLPPGLPLPPAPPEHEIAKSEPGVENGRHFAKVTVKVEPPVGPRQRAFLLLNRTGGPETFAFPAEPRETDATSLVFRVKGLPADAYLARVRVDGAESLLDVAPVGAPDAGAYVAPRLVVP